MEEIEIKEGSSSSESNEDESSQSGEAVSPGKFSGSEGEEKQIVEFSDVEPKRKQKRLNRRERNKRILARRDRDRIALVLPDLVADREKERALVRVATKGVVQLFNAVSERQKELEEKLLSGENKLDKHAKKQVLKRFGRSKFEERLAKIGRVKDEIMSVNGFSGSISRQLSANDMDAKPIKKEPESKED